MTTSPSRDETPSVDLLLISEGADAPPWDWGTMVALGSDPAGVSAMVEVCRASGLLDLVYDPEGSVPWPTLREMIENEQRTNQAIRSLKRALTKLG